MDANNTPAIETTPSQSTLNRVTLTECAVCSKGLHDPRSVELGIGPVCRRKTGFNKVPEAKRQLARDLVYRIAALRTQGLHKEARHEVLVSADALKEMGLTVLATAIMRANCQVGVHVDGSDLLVDAPRMDDWSAWSRVFGRRTWDANARRRRIPGKHHAVLMAFLGCHFAGRAVVLTKEGTEEGRTIWLSDEPCAEPAKASAPKPSTQAATYQGTPAKLRNGDWGVRIDRADPQRPEPQPGDLVCVTTKSGSTFAKRVVRIERTTDDAWIASTSWVD